MAEDKPETIAKKKTTTKKATQEREKQVRRRAMAVIGELEADLAYFDARMALIGDDPETPYQKAQFKLFRALDRQLKSRLDKCKQDLSNLGVTR